MYQSENFEIKIVKFERRTIIKLLLNQLEVSAFFRKVENSFSKI